MKNIHKVPDEERVYFKKCPKCGEYFDTRDLAEFFGHSHGVKVPEPTWVRLRKIGHPEEFLNGKRLTKIYLN